MAPTPGDTAPADGVALMGLDERAAVGVPSALDVWLGECPRRNSRGESARSGLVARRAARPALAAEAFAPGRPASAR